MTLETKVVAPTITTLGIGGLVLAVFQVAKAFGLDLSEEQTRALMGLGAALMPLVQFAVGYYAPHTARPDIHHEDEPPAEPAVDRPRKTMYSQPAAQRLDEATVEPAEPAAY